MTLYDLRTTDSVENYIKKTGSCYLQVRDDVALFMRMESCIIDQLFTFYTRSMSLTR